MRAKLLSSFKSFAKEVAPTSILLLLVLVIAATFIHAHQQVHLLLPFGVALLLFDVALDYITYRYFIPYMNKIVQDMGVDPPSKIQITNVREWFAYRKGEELFSLAFTAVTLFFAAELFLKVGNIPW